MAPTATASVNIHGTSADPVTIELPVDATVADFLARAAKDLNFPEAGLDHLSPVLNGFSAELDDIVPDQATLSAAPRVANG